MIKESQFVTFQAIQHDNHKNIIRVPTLLHGYDIIKESQLETFQTIRHGGYDIQSKSHNFFKNPLKEHNSYYK